MTGFEIEKGGNFKTGAPVPGLTNLTGIFDHFRAVCLALLAMSLHGRPGEAEHQGQESDQPHGFPVLIPLLGSQRPAYPKKPANFLNFDL